MVVDEAGRATLQAQVAGFAARNAARQRDLRRLVEKQKLALEAANRRDVELQVQISSARTMQLLPPAKGYQQLLIAQLENLNTEISGEDTWAPIVAKNLKKKKPKDAKGDVIVELNPPSF